MLSKSFTNSEATAMQIRNLWKTNQRDLLESSKNQLRFFQDSNTLNVSFLNFFITMFDVFVV